MERERDMLGVADLTWNADGLIPVIVQQAGTSEVLMLAWMDSTALERTLETGRAWYWSRSRAEYWMKGGTSDAVQDVREVRYDCDADTLLLVVDQHGTGACHTGERSCFYRTLPLAVQAGEVSAESAPAREPRLGDVLEELCGVIAQRGLEKPEGSYTVKLLTGPQDKLLKKIAEESGEVIIAARDHDLAQTRYEIGDLMYHLLVVMQREGVEPGDLARELAERRR